MTRLLYHRLLVILLAAIVVFGGWFAADWQLRQAEAAANWHAATVAQRKKADQYRRAELVREMDNAVLVSIHQNCYPDRKPSGAQVLYAASTGSDTLGIQMHDNLVTYLDPQNRRVAAPISEKIYLMHAVQCPAVLVECGFLSNASECAKLKDADYQAKLATVIIASYLQYRQSLPQTGMIT